MSSGDGNRACIGGWPHPKGDRRPDVIVADKLHIEEIRYLVDEREIAVPIGLYYFVPEARPYQDVVRYWLKYHRHPTFDVRDVQPYVAQFFLSLEAICADPMACTDREVQALFRAAPEELRASIPSLEYIEECLSVALGELGERLLCSVGAYSDFVPTRDSRAWWRIGATNSGKVALRFEWLKAQAARYAGLTPLVNNALPITDIVKSFGAAGLSDSLDNAAICSLRAAMMQRKFRQTAVAVVCMHRTLDLFLQARCCENQLVVETVNGLKFTADAKKKDMVGVLNCYTALIDNQVYVRKKSVREDLIACNEIRNNSGLAHSVYGATEAYADRYQSTVLKVMHEIDSSVARRIVRRAGAGTAAAGGLQLDPAILFATEADFSACLVEAF